MFLHKALYMSLFKQFTKELAIYFQSCISALTYCLVVFFWKNKMDCISKCRMMTFNLAIDNNILHITLHIVNNLKNNTFLRGVR